MVLVSVADVPRIDTISEARMPPSVHGRVKMRWMRPFWRITTSLLFVSSSAPTFESTEFSRAKLGPRTVRNDTPHRFHPFTDLNSNTQ